MADPSNCPWVFGAFETIAPVTAKPGVERRTFDTVGSTVTEYRFSAGAIFPRHQHPEEQVMFVQEGAVTFTAGAETRTVEAGGYCAIGPDVPHGLSTEGGARVLCMVVPRRAAPPAV